jgi:hypothetical protein
VYAVPFWTVRLLHSVPMHSELGPTGKVKSPSCAVTVDGIAVPPEPVVDDFMN